MVQLLLLPEPFGLDADLLVAVRESPDPVTQLSGKTKEWRLNGVDCCDIDVYITSKFCEDLLVLLLRDLLTLVWTRRGRF